MRYLLVFLCLLFLATTGVIAYKFRRTIATMDQTNQIEQTSRNLLLAMVDTETGQRGFIITDNEGYLAPYNAGLADSAVWLKNLQDAAAGTSQAKLVGRLTDLIQQKTAELEETLQLRRSQGFAAAAAKVDTDVGKDLMDDVRVQIDLLTLWSISQYQAATDTLRLCARLGLASTVATLFFGFWGVNKR